MKRVWIIPAVACFLLLVAWPLRWKIESIDCYGTVHLQDRWTGQRWEVCATHGDSKPNINKLIFIGPSSWSMYSPVLSQKAVEKEKKSVIKTCLAICGSEKAVEKILADWPSPGNTAADRLEKALGGEQVIEEALESLDSQIIAIPKEAPVPPGWIKLNKEKAQELLEYFDKQLKDIGKKDISKTKRNVSLSEFAEEIASRRLWDAAENKLYLGTIIWGVLVFMSATIAGKLFPRS